MVVLKNVENNFKKGDKIERKDGAQFSNEQHVNTVSKILDGDRIYMSESGTYIEMDKVKLVKRVNPIANLENRTENERPDSEHYHTGGIDVWEFAKANFSYEALFGFHQINIIKYLTRFGKKNGRNIKDLEKAKAIIEELIKMEKERAAND